MGELENVTIPREEYNALIVLRDKIETLKNMIVSCEIQSWEQALVIIGDMIAYDEYITTKLEGESK